MIHGSIPDKSLGKTAKKGVVWSFLREGVTEVVTFPASMILARLLTPREFGIAAAAGFFTLLAGRLSELGFNAALVRAKVLEEVHLSTVFVVNLTVGLITFAGLTALAPAVARFYDTPETGRILPIAALAFLIAPLGTVPAALLARNLQYKKSAMVDWYQSLAFAATTLLLAWSGFSYMSMVYGKLVAVIVQAACRMTFARWRPSLRFSAAALREIFPFGAGVHVKRLLDYAAQNVDNLVVGRLFGMVGLGLYDKAFSTMNRFLVRMNTEGPNLTFRIFAIIHEDRERFKAAYHKVVMSATLVGYPVFAVLIATAPQLIQVLFGDRWMAAVQPFQVLCIAACLKLLNTYASATTQAVGRIWSEVWRQAAYAILIVGALVVFRSWGPLGAACGVLVATAVMTLLMETLLIRVTPLDISDLVRPQVPAVICACGAAATVLALSRVLAAASIRPQPLVLLVAQALAAVVYYAAFVLFVPLRPLRQLVREVAKDLTPAYLQRQEWVRRYLRVAPVAVETAG